MSYLGRALTAGNYLKLDDLSSQFNGTQKTFNLTSGGQAFYPGSAFSILVSLGGVIQEPESAYQINQSQITFAVAPQVSDDFFCIALGVALGVGVPADGSVTPAKLTKPFNYNDGHLTLDTTNDRVGINSSIPGYTLDVQGDIKGTNFIGNGENLSGISGFATALSSDNNSSLFQIFKTPKKLTISSGSSVTVEVGSGEDNIAFTRASIIQVAVGATFHIKSGTTLKTNILNIF